MYKRQVYRWIGCSALERSIDFVPKLVTVVRMTRTTSVALGDHFSQFINDQVAAGRYASASDVVRSGLRLLEEREAQMTALRGALDVGEASGTPEPFDIDAFVAGRRGAG